LIVRILLPVHAFPPASTAGVEVYTCRLARALADRGHDVLVLAAVHDLAAEPYHVRWREHEGIAVAELPSLHLEGTLEATYADARLETAMQGVLERFRPYVVHVQHLLNLSAGLLGQARRFGAAVVLTLHDYWLSCPRDGLRMREDLALCATVDHAVCARCLESSPYLVPSVQRTLAGAARRAGLGRHVHRLHDLAPAATERVLAVLRRASGAPRGLTAGMDQRASVLRAAVRHAHVVVAPTRFARERALEFGVSDRAVRVLPLGAVLEPARARAAGPRPRVGYVGTLAPHKGVRALVEAFRGLAGPELTLDVFGSTTVHPAYVNELRAAAGGDRRIRFRGPFPEGEQHRVFAEIDVLAAPSLWWENSPLTVLEALATGLPVIASATGGVPELVEDGAAGILVPPGDVGALGRALADVTAGIRLGEARAPVHVKTAGEGADELVELYASLLERPARAETG
jgi:glycosyltransferase involved in cell wall biosynthesis